MIREEIWLFVFICAILKVMVNGEKTDVEKHYIRRFGEQEVNPETFWRGVSLIGKHRNAKLANVCSAAQSYLLEASRARPSRASSSSKPKMASYALKMNAALRITDVVGTIAVQILICTPQSGDAFRLTKGRDDNWVYFVSPSATRATQEGIEVETGTLDSGYTADVDLSRWFDIGKFTTDENLSSDED